MKPENPKIIKVVSHIVSVLYLELLEEIYRVFYVKKKNTYDFVLAKNQEGEIVVDRELIERLCKIADCELVIKSH